MQSGITFVNGAQLNMSADRLDIASPGGINFETDVRVENLSATDLTATTLETQTATVSNELQVVPADGVTGAGFDRLDQSPDIVRIDGDVVRLAQDIDLNSRAIDQNAANIASNAADTVMLQLDVQDNRNQIGINAQNINDVGTQVGQLMSDIEDMENGTNTEVSVCAPLWATVNNQMAAAGYRYYSYCGDSCTKGCPEWTGTYRCAGPSSLNPVTYMRRDISTLNCETLIANFYTSAWCRSTISGNPCK